MSLCGMCDHESHHDTDCGEVVGYDHMNGDHECGCPGDDGSLAALRAGVEAVITDRHDGDFAPILPKLRALLNAE